MMGRWQGEGYPTGHPQDGLLEAFHWYGKHLESSEDVHPLLLSNRRGEVVSINPIQQIVTALVEAMRRSGATAPADQLTDSAYLIVCLSEKNVALQAVGFGRRQQRAAARHASEILDRVLPERASQGVDA